MEKRKQVSHNSNKQKRRSIRLKDYDYSQAGGYFVTICTYNWRFLFGNITNEKMIVNNYGKIAIKCWNEILKHFRNIQLDEFVVMPNHVHGILMMIDCRGTACRALTVEQFGRPVKNSLPTIVRSFKSAVTNKINKMRGITGVSIWQRNYYEHVIRNNDKLYKIRQYIQNNPLKWHLDRENPERVGVDKLEEKIFGPVKIEKEV